MGAFLFFYLILIITVVCFLISLFIKYFGFKPPEKLKELFCKVPKVKGIFEKLKMCREKLRLSVFLKSLASSLKTADKDYKLSGNVNIDEEDINVSKESFKIKYNDITNGALNDEAAETKGLQAGRELSAEFQVKTAVEEVRYQESMSRPEPVDVKTSAGNDKASGHAPVDLENDLPAKAPVPKNKTPVPEKEPVRKQNDEKKPAAKEPYVRESAEQNKKKHDKPNLLKKKKKYEIVQTGFASVFFSKSDNIVIIPYARDILGKGRAMDRITFLKYPIVPDQLGKAVQGSLNIGDDVCPYTDKELVKELEVKEWEDFTSGRKHISIRYDKGCGYILNTTTRNPDGSYRLNCPGGIEKIVRKNASSEELGDTMLNLVERCKV